MTVPLPLFATSSFTTYGCSFDDEIAACKAAGIKGLGLWEHKLAGKPDDERVDAFRASDLAATFCFPDVPGIIYGDQLFPEPRDPQERLALLLAGIKRLARFDPVAVVCLAGPRRGVERSAAWANVVKALREAAYAAGELGVPLALEPIRRGQGDSLVATLPEALDMIDDIGVPGMGVLFDTWHFWDAPDDIAALPKFQEHVLGVQVNDRASSARGWADRVLPGQGDIDFASLIDRIRTSGYAGWYELEVFSDDGTFGTEYADSLWKLPPAELLTRGRRAFEDAWRAAAE